MGVWLETAPHDGPSFRNEGSGTIDAQAGASVAPQVTMDLSNNDDTIEREEDALYTQMLADYIDDIYNWYFNAVL